MAVIQAVEYGNDIYQRTSLNVSPTYNLPAGYYICPSAHLFDITFNNINYSGFVYAVLDTQTNICTLKLHETLLTHIYVFWNEDEGILYVNRTNGVYNPYTLNVTELVSILNLTSTSSITGMLYIEKNYTNKISTYKDAWKYVAGLSTRPAGLTVDSDRLLIPNTFSDLNTSKVKIKTNPSHSYARFLCIKFEDLAPRPNPTSNFLLFKCTSPSGGSISLNRTNAQTLPNPNLLYRINFTTWYSWDYSSLTVNLNDVIEFKGTNTSGFNFGYYDYSVFQFTAPFEGSGNIMSIIDGNENGTLTIPNEYCFYKLFYGNIYLETPPSLPATTLLPECYQRLFSGCTSLKEYGYSLPADRAEYACYAFMFEGCTSLLVGPNIDATEFCGSCCSGMFWLCSSLISAPLVLSGVTVYDADANGYQFSSMFLGCTSLQRGPVIDVNRFREHICAQMFRMCSSLKYIKCTTTNFLNVAGATDSWVEYVDSVGEFAVPRSVKTDWAVKAEDHGKPTNFIWNTWE